MLEDLDTGVYLHPDADDVIALVQGRQPHYFSFADWLEIDAMEVEKGQQQGRPRIKFTTVAEMLAVLGRS
jgi:ferredoxin--NADP+ reductase